MLTVFGWSSSLDFWQGFKYAYGWFSSGFESVNGNYTNTRMEANKTKIMNYLYARVILEIFHLKFKKLWSFIKRPTNSSTSTTSGQTNGQTSTTGGQMDTTNGQTSTTRG